MANNANVGAAAKSRRAKGEKAPKTSKAPKPKRVSALDAAAQVLAASEVPMRAKEMIAAMEAKGLWRSHPSFLWLAMYATALSRCASSELNSWLSPSSVLLRV